MRLFSLPCFRYSRKQQTSRSFPPGAAGGSPGWLWPCLIVSQAWRLPTCFGSAQKHQPPCTTHYISLLTNGRYFSFAQEKFKGNIILEWKEMAFGTRASWLHPSFYGSSQLTLLAYLLPGDKGLRAIKIAQQVKTLGAQTWSPDS